MSSLEKTAVNHSTIHPYQQNETTPPTASPPKEYPHASAPSFTLKMPLDTKEPT